MGIYVAAVVCIDTSGISMLEEVKKIIDRRELKVINCTLLVLSFNMRNYD